MTDLWNDLLTCLELRPAPSAPEPVTGFEGPNQHLGYHRLFGGQLLAQFVRAAALTCPDKAVKSLHAQFPREGLTHEPVRYEVTRHREGGTFATLTIVARQTPGVIATASVSLHAEEAGLDQQSDFEVPSVPGPEHDVDLGLIPGRPGRYPTWSPRRRSRPSTTCGCARRRSPPNSPRRSSRTPPT